MLRVLTYQTSELRKSSLMLISDVLKSFPDPVAVLSDHVQSRRTDAVFVVLDEDPTGTQSVADLPVLTSWAVEDMAWALRNVVRCRGARAVDQAGHGQGSDAAGHRLPLGTHGRTGLRHPVRRVRRQRRYRHLAHPLPSWTCWTRPGVRGIVRRSLAAHVGRQSITSASMMSQVSVRVV